MALLLPIVHCMPLSRDPRATTRLGRPPPQRGHGLLMLGGIRVPAGALSDSYPSRGVSVQPNAGQRGRLRQPGSHMSGGRSNTADCRPSAAWPYSPNLDSSSTACHVTQHMATTIAEGCPSAVGARWGAGSGEPSNARILSDRITHLAGAVLELPLAASPARPRLGRVPRHIGKAGCRTRVQERRGAGWVQRHWARLTGGMLASTQRFF